MSTSCEGCFISKNGQDEAMQAATTQARLYAQVNGYSMAIYREGFEFMYMKADVASDLGLMILDIIPYE